MINVHEILEISELSSARLVWNRLLPETRSPSFFHTLVWMEVFARQFSEQYHPRILLIQNNGQPLGILPLFQHTQGALLLKKQILNYPQALGGSFCGPIGPHPTATLLAAYRHLFDEQRDFDAVELQGVDLDDTDCGRLRQVLRQLEIPYTEKPWLNVPVVQFPNVWEEYWDHWPEQKHFDLNEAEHRLNRRDSLEIHRYRPLGTAQGDGLPQYELLDACIQIAEKDPAHGSSATDEEHLNDLFSLKNDHLLYDLHQNATHFGGLDLNLLLLDQKPIAFSYNVHYQGRVSVLSCGCLPVYREARAMDILIKWMLEEGDDRGDYRYDLIPRSGLDTNLWANQNKTAYLYRFGGRWLPQRFPFHTVSKQ